MKKCSFCNKTQEQVRAMIAGPDVNICTECIDLCIIALTHKGFMNHKYRDKYRHMWE